MTFQKGVKLPREDISG